MYVLIYRCHSKLSLYSHETEISSIFLKCENLKSLAKLFCIMSFIHSFRVTKLPENEHEDTSLYSSCTAWISSSIDLADFLFCKGWTELKNLRSNTVRSGNFAAALAVSYSKLPFLLISE